MPPRVCGEGFAIVIRTLNWGGRDVPLVDCLPCKDEDFSLIPESLSKERKPGIVVLTCDPEDAGKKHEVPRRLRENSRMVDTVKPLKIK